MAYAIMKNNANIKATTNASIALPVRFLALKSAMIGGTTTNLTKIKFPLPPRFISENASRLVIIIIEPYTANSPIPILSVRVCSFTG